MKTYKTHLSITDAKGNFKKYACNISKNNGQDSTHNLSDVTCSHCAGKVNLGLVVENYGHFFSKILK